MDMYVRMYGDLKRNEGDNPTVAIFLCEAKEQLMVCYQVINAASNCLPAATIRCCPLKTICALS